MQTKHIALVIGSLRRDSINRKVAQYIQNIAPSSWQLPRCRSVIYRCITKTLMSSRLPNTIV